MQAGRLNRRCILQTPRTTSKTGCAFTSTVQARRTCISAPDHAESLLASINVAAGF